MANLFVLFKTKAAFNAATLGTGYSNDSIVFIQDTQEIWTHGVFYAIPDSYKTKITNLETAVQALQTANANLFAIKTVSDGTSDFVAATGKEKITFKAGDHASVEVDPLTGEIAIDSVNTLTTGTANGSVAFNGKDVPVKGLGDAAYETKKYFDDAIAEAKAAGDGANTALEAYKTSNNTAVAAAKSAADAAKAAADAKVATVSAGDGLKVTGDATDPVIGLLIDSTGNVTLTKSANGLKADVTIPEADVVGVTANDKILALGADKKLATTLKLAYNPTDKKIKLTGIDDALISEVDATEFIKDGMVDNVTFDTTTKILTITFNTASGKEAIPVDLTSLVDTYDGSNVKLKNIAIPSTDAVEPAANDSVDSAVANLIKKDRELKATIDANAGNITNIQTNQLTEIEKGTDGDFVTTTVGAKASNKQAVSVAVTTKAVENASAIDNGLATAYNTKQYVDNKFAWTVYE